MFPGWLPPFTSPPPWGRGIAQGVRIEENPLGGLGSQVKVFDRDELGASNLDLITGAPFGTPVDMTTPMLDVRGYSGLAFCFSSDALTGACNVTPTCYYYLPDQMRAGVNNWSTRWFFQDGAGGVAFAFPGAGNFNWRMWNISRASVTTRAPVVYVSIRFQIDANPAAASCSIVAVAFNNNSGN